MVKSSKRCGFSAGAACFVLLLPARASAAGGYLAGYENAGPKPATVSWWSTIAYLVSLFAVFAFVVAMAYLASRYLGGHFARAAEAEGGRILTQLPVGPNRSVMVVELAGQVYVLGVTEHNISLIGEIEDEDEIERLRSRASERAGSIGGGNAGDGVLSRQLGSLEALLSRVPSILKGGRQ